MPPVDTDSDGIADVIDNCPGDPNPTQDDSDGDDVGDVCDACEGFDDTQDLDADAVPDGCDSDDDNDGVDDPDDSAPSDPALCADIDADGCDDCSVPVDGFGPLADNDPTNDGLDNDADGICNTGDNCPDDPNPGQEDSDSDGAGDVCEDGYTPVGEEVVVDVTASLAITFGEVTAPGETTVTTQTSGPPPDDGYGVVPTQGAPIYYDIETTAEISGEITVCFAYDESQVSGQEANLRPTHWEGDPPHPVDITTSVDPDAHVLCGVTTSLSPFALVEWVGCCVGRVGDANNSGEDDPTIGDVAELVDHLFIDKPVLVCVAEADINQSGGIDPSQEQPGSDITIGDVADLVDYLFITGPELGVLPDCL